MRALNCKVRYNFRTYIPPLYVIPQSMNPIYSLKMTCYRAITCHTYHCKFCYLQCKVWLLWPETAKFANDECIFRGHPSPSIFQISPAMPICSDCSIDFDRLVDNETCQMCKQLEGKSAVEKSVIKASTFHVPTSLIFTNCTGQGTMQNMFNCLHESRQSPLQWVLHVL